MNEIPDPLRLKRAKQKFLQAATDLEKQRGSLPPDQQQTLSDITYENDPILHQEPTTTLPPSEPENN